MHPLASHSIYKSPLPDQLTNSDINNALGKARDLEKEGAHEEAYKTYHSLAMEQDNPEAKYRCGLMLLEGRGVTRHLAQAVHFLKDAARAEHKDAALTHIAPCNRLTELMQVAFLFGQSCKSSLPNTTVELPLDLQKVAVAIILAEKKGFVPEEWTEIITPHDLMTLLDDLISCMEDLSYHPMAELLTALRAGDLLPLLKEGVQAYNEENATSVAIVTEEKETPVAEVTQDTLLREMWQQIGSLLSRRDYHQLRTTSKSQAAILPSSREKGWDVCLRDIPKTDYEAFCQHFENLKAPVLNIKLEGDMVDSKLPNLLYSHIARNSHLKALQLEVPTPCLTKKNIAFLGALTSLTSLNISNPHEYTGRKDELADKEMSPMANLTKLSLLNMSNHYYLRDKALQFAAKLTQLETLHLASINLTAAGLAHLSQFTKLKLLDISGNTKVGDKGLEIVAGLTKLEALFMQDTGLTAAALETSLPKLTNLKVLDISYNQKSGDEVLKTLAGSTQLEALFMASIGLTVKGIMHLCQLTHLKVLDISYNEQVGAQGLEIVAGLTKLETLILKRMDLTAARMTHLLQLTCLKLLDISYNREVGAEGLKIVAGLTKLETLILRSMDLTAAEMTHLLQLPHLKELDIGFNEQLGDKGLQLATGLTQLETLGMGRTRLTLEGLMAHLSQFTHLKSLDITGNNLLTDKEKELLAKQYPDMHIQF